MYICTLVETVASIRIQIIYCRFISISHDCEHDMLEWCKTKSLKISKRGHQKALCDEISSYGFLVLLIHYFRKMTNTWDLLFQTGMITSINDCQLIQLFVISYQLHMLLQDVIQHRSSLVEKYKLKIIERNPRSYSGLSQIAILDRLVSRYQSKIVAWSKMNVKSCHSDLNKSRV